MFGFTCFVGCFADTFLGLLFVVVAGFCCCFTVCLFICFVYVLGDVLFCLYYCLTLFIYDC